MAGLRDKSKETYTSPNQPTYKSIQTGCLQRIADATEAMAKRHTELISDLEWYKARYNDHIASIDRQNRKISSLKGVITKQRNKIQKLKENARNSGDDGINEFVL